MVSACVLIACLLCAWGPSVLSSEIVLNATTSSIRPLLTQDFKVRCSLRDTAVSGSIIGRRSVQHSVPAPRKGLTSTTDNVDFVTSMVISRDGVDLATITEHIPAKALGNFTGLQVSGSLSGQAGVKGYLEVRWRHPSALQAGNFRCDADTVNGQGHSFDFSQTLEVMDEEISFTDLVQHVLQMEQDKDKLTDDVTRSGVTLAEVNKTLAAVKAENAALRQTVAALKNQSSSLPKVFFSSTLTWDKVISDGSTVVYDGLLVNEGNAYNSNTGVFTCPIDGFYHFEVNALSENSLNFELELQHNSQYVVSVLSMGAQGYQGSSNSATLRVAKGDVVKVVGAYSRSYLHGNSQQHEALSSFSGRLIALD